MPHLEMLDLPMYVRAIKGVFQEIAVVFSPQPLRHQWPPQWH